MTAPDARDFLLSLPRFTDQGAAAYRPGLARMHRLLEGMGHPHEAFESVHVAGTNGKGSTASLLAAVATAAGRRVGLHTSPHLHHLTERMRIDGVPAPEAWLADAVGRFRTLFEAESPSFFEATVALSFLYFAETGVDLAVVEVGMGGRLDATNVLHPRLALITGIGRDHTEFLGHTLPEIAREKAGIIKPGVPVATAAHQPEVVSVLREVAGRQASPLHLVREEVEVLEVDPAPAALHLRIRTPVRRYDRLRVGLPGRHQEWNALLALRAAELVLGEVPQEAVCTGMADVRRLAGLRGRLERLGTRPLVVADVAHNPEGIAAALAYLHAQLGTGRLFVLFGTMRDKDAAEMVRLFTGTAAAVFPVVLDTPRALPAPELAALLSGGGVEVAEGGTVERGLAWFHRQARPEDALLITGSHLVVAQLPEVLPPAPPSGRPAEPC